MGRGFMERQEEGIALPIIAVLGPGDASFEEIRVAERVGGAAAHAGWVVLTGGGPGVMAAASRGAVEAGGLTVGILPTSGPTADYPNRWVVVPVYTGSGSARNQFNVLSADLCLAIGGGAGTLSEIGLALKAGKEVWCLNSWLLEPPTGTAPKMPTVFESAEGLLAELTVRLSG